MNVTQPAFAHKIPPLIAPGEDDVRMTLAAMIGMSKALSRILDGEGNASLAQYVMQAAQDADRVMKRSRERGL